MDRQDAVDYTDIATALSRYLRARTRVLLSDQDDLIQQTLLDVYRRNVEMKAPHDIEEARLVAFSILRRRLVDRYRQVARSVVAEKFPDSVIDTPQDGDVPSAVSYRQLLLKVLKLIAFMSPRDQDLILDDVLPNSRISPWSEAERKQISRLREQLRRDLAEKFSIDIKDALKE